MLTAVPNCERAHGQPISLSDVRWTLATNSQNFVIETALTLIVIREEELRFDEIFLRQSPTTD